MTAHYVEQTPKTVYLHWTAGNYGQVFTAYHACITVRRSYILPWTWVAKVVKSHPYDRKLNVHTAYRNGDSVALSCCGAAKNYPIRREQIEVMCLEAARVCLKYNIPVDKDHIISHARAARLDGYYPERVDFDGRDDELIGKIRYYANKIKAGDLKP